MTGKRFGFAQIRRNPRIPFAGCAGILAAALGVTITAPPPATATWTIRPGGAITARSGRAIVRDTATGSIISCRSVSASGTLKSGSGLSGASAGSVSAAGFHMCTVADLTFMLRPAGLPWHLNLSSYTSGVTAGTISHLHVNASGFGCSVVIDGTAATARDGIVRFTYADSTGRLKLLTTGGNLHFYPVRDCAGLISDGDPATLSAAFTVVPKQTITSP